jgi:hypothetical protein
MMTRSFFERANQWAKLARIHQYHGDWWRMHRCLLRRIRWIDKALAQAGYMRQRDVML